MIRATVDGDGQQRLPKALRATPFTLDLEAALRDRHWRGVEALLGHDRRRRTALLETLEGYPHLRRSVVETARALNVHPNTLRQRLARIEGVAGLDVGVEDSLALEPR